MDFQAFLFLILIVSLVSFFGFQGFVHKKRLKSFRYRIHVNGTRGKSSITRLIRAGLAKGGHSVVAKTTGTLARIIYSDGSELSVRRWGRPTILEQIRIVKEAYKEKAEIFVIECMALEPRYQFSSEVQILNSNISVISNVRPDHLEVMGPTLDDVRKAFASAIPLNGKLVLLESENSSIFTNACTDRRSEIVFVSKEEVLSQSDQDMMLFQYWEHKENVAIALKVCEILGVTREIAFKGMLEMEPDPGALTVFPIHFFGKKLTFLNALAANDPQSSRLIWNEANMKYAKGSVRALLLHCRDDRIERSIQLARETSTWSGVQFVFLTGTGTTIAESEMKRLFQPGIKFLNLEGKSPELIFESLLAQNESGSVIMALGNIGGVGLELIQLIRNRSENNH